MSARAAIATAGGLIFLAGWVGASLILSDHVAGAGTLAQLVYFAIAGSLWVLPMTLLILWAARSRQP